MMVLHCAGLFPHGAGCWVPLAPPTVCQCGLPDIVTTKNAPPHIQMSLGRGEFPLIHAHTETLQEMGPIFMSHAKLGYNILRAHNFASSLDDMSCYQVPFGVLALEI